MVVGKAEFLIHHSTKVRGYSLESGGLMKFRLALVLFLLFFETVGFAGHKKKAPAARGSEVERNRASLQAGMMFGGFALPAPKGQATPGAGELPPPPTFQNAPELLDGAIAE
jgi:hypothetical protein